ncbi:MAG: hypothetical protein VKM92_02840 [Cyanobacteriota bacterium]|nr:hypothetical protein [Cyanobacteriota bacterium]
MVVLALIAGAATLVARSGSTVFGAVFQKQSWEARSVAEVGMATLVSRLNREENRYLLAAPPAAVNPSYSRNSRWTTDAAVLLENHSNPCADTYVVSPSTGLKTRVSTPPSINNIYPSGNRNGWWYVTSSGQVSTSASNAVGRFRLIGEEGDKKFKMAARKDGAEELNFSLANGKSSIKLSVEAVAMNINGSDKSRAVLEEVLDVVPKCCRTTFGSYHGSNNYTATYSSANAFGQGTCVPPMSGDSFGIVFGVSGDGGLMKTGGNATEVWRREDNGNKTMINPVGCIQTGTSTCRIDGGFNNITPTNVSALLEILNTSVPKAPQWYPGRPSSVPLPNSYLPLAATATSGSANLSVCQGKAADSGNDCRLVSEAESATTPYFRYCMDANCSRTIINGNASAANLPSHCKFSPSPPNGDGALHCVVSRLNLGGGGGVLQFASGILPSGSTNATPKPIRIYFAVPSSSKNDYLIDQGGSTLVEHCVAATANLPNNSTDLSNPNIRRCRGLDTPYKERVTLLSMFGCNPNSNYYGQVCIPPQDALPTSRGAQYFKLQGNASTLGYFSYFPYGNIELQGNSDVEGVIWTNNIQVGGSGDFIVPASGVNDAFELLGINAGVNNNCDGSIYGSCPEGWQPKWDFVARSVRRFAFKFD